MNTDAIVSEIIHDVYVAIDDAELYSFRDAYGDNNAVRVIRGDNEYVVAIGDAEFDDDDNLIVCWTAYQRRAADFRGDFEEITDTDADVADAVSERVQAWLARRS